jgi:uncharacterized protein (DUF427 family)
MEVPGPRVEPSPRWIRVRAGGEWVADSRRALLLAWYGPGMLPTYCFPPEDVRGDLLAGLGDAAIELLGLPAAVAAADGTWTFAWDGRVQWFEEAMEVFVHAKDTTKRVDVLPSERHVRIELAGELIAESRRPHALFETTLPTRWYLPAEDVRMDLLEPSSTVTQCPYKGTARYWSVRAGGELHPDVAWSYPDPIPENPRIAGLVAFFNEKVDLTIDGVRESRPETPWSR